MKKILKLAWKNLFCLPLRTFLCFFVVFVSTVAVVVCYNLYSTGTKAVERFKNDYAAVASVYPREFARVDSDGTVSTNILLGRGELEILRKSDAVAAYGYSCRAGTIAYDELISKLPDNELFEKSPVEKFTNSSFGIIAVDNIMLQQRFFCGDSVLISGSFFDAEDVALGNRVIVVSDALAEKYDLQVGDTVVVMPRTDNYVAFTVKGVYSSKVGFTESYVPYSSFAKLNMHVNYSEIFRQEMPFERMDFLLNSVEDGDEFISDAIKNGFDTSVYDITVNDKPYKIALSGMESLCTVSAVVFFSVLGAGTALVVLITVLYASVRQKEKQILRALGMKRYAIGAMMLVETVVIISVSIALGIAASFPVSQFAIKLADEKQTSDTATEESWSVIDPFDPSPEITLNRDMDFSLIDSQNTSIKEYIIPYARPVCGTDEIAYRFEKLWTEDGKEFTVVGATESAELGFENKASYEYESHMAEYPRNSLLAFACYVSEGSGYKVGDKIKLYTISPKAIARFSGDKYENTAKIAIILRVEGIFSEDVGGDILMPMEEMELMCDCAYVHTEGYRNDRYDKVVKK